MREDGMAYQGAKTPLALVVLSFAMLACGCGGNWSAEAVAASQARGDEIIAAVGRYQADHGVYPQTLDALVPRYLQRILPPDAGDRKWRYEAVDDGRQFNISFAGPNYDDPVCWYDSSRPHWDLDKRDL